jgi:hypothetical protein
MAGVVVDDRQKALEDFHFLQNLIANKDQVVAAAFPDRKTQVLELLDRALQRGGRRGGPTKVQLLELREFSPGEFSVPDQRSKGDITQEIIHNINGGEGVIPPPIVPITPAPFPDGIPTGPVPEGWGEYVPQVSPTVVEKPLLLLRRGKLFHPKEVQLRMLLQEQEEWNIAKQGGDVTLLPYLRANIQEISGNDAPTPDTDVWIRYIYTQALEVEVEKIRKLIFTTGSRTINMVSGARDTSSSASSSDIESYCPNKSSRFNIAIKMGGKEKRKQKRKRKRKKKRKGRSKKRSRRKRRSDTSSSSDSSSSSSDTSEDEVQPNGRRVSARVYGPNHYEQL